MVALKHFPNIDRQAALGRPILYSNWLSKDYVPVDREELRDFTRARLKVGCKFISDSKLIEGGFKRILNAIRNGSSSFLCSLLLYRLLTAMKIEIPM